MIYYSTSTKGFYDSEINTSIPSDKKEMSDELHASLMGKQANLGGTIIFPADGSIPTFEAIPWDAMGQLREHRDKLLVETDWMSLQDSPAIADAWKAYRKKLRDITDSSDPQFSDDGSLINVTWPTKPE